MIKQLYIEYFTGLHELLGEPLAVVLAGHEDIQVLLLKFAGDTRGYLLGRRGTEDGGETGCGAVNELDAPLSEDDVIGSAQPDVVLGNVFRLGVEIGVFEVTDGLDHLFSPEGGHTGIQD